MFGSIAKMLKPGGKVIVSVPNPWYINAIVKNLFQGESFVDNVDHVCWFDPCSLAELGERHGLKLERFVGITSPLAHAKGSFIKLLFSLKPISIALGVRPEIYAKTLSYELVKTA